jgi:O-antigen/teichoic acid export membrane protein
LAFLATWSAAGAAAAVVAAVTLRVLPDVSRAWSWLRQHRTLCRRLLAEFVLTSGSYYVIYFGLAALSGASALGRLKAAQALFGPATVLLLGGMALGVPESVRARGDSSTLRRFAARLSMFLAAISVASGVIAFAVLPVVGPRLFPNSWTTARPLLPLLTVFSAAIGISTGATSGLRAVDAGRWIMRARGAEGVVAVVTALPATVAAGAKGALFGLALGEIAFAAAAWRQLALRVAAEAPALPDRG